MPGLSVWYMDVDERSDSAFNALFSWRVDVDTQTMGDRFHGADAWLKEGYVQLVGQWAAV